MQIISLKTYTYDDGLLRQQELVNEVQNDAEDTLILCEHPHVYTFGKSANTNNLLINPEFLKKINATVYQTERGGDITYHGPGQLVGYPIINLKRKNWGVRKYVDTLEDVLINSLSMYHIAAFKIDGLTGIWVKNQQGFDAKIGAIGIRVKNGVSFHGFALNVHPDLSYFNHIVPCGIQDKGVTSMRDLGINCSIKSFSEKFVTCFNQIF
jgi:lipoyl(octanoyl) transferase